MELNSTSPIFEDDDDLIVPVREDDPYLLWKIFQTWLKIATVLKFGVLLAAMAVWIFLIYTLLKFHRLKAKSGLYLLHYGLCGLLDYSFLIGLQIFHEIVHYNYYTTNTVRRAVCVAYHSKATLMIMTLYFATLLGVEYFAENRKKAWKSQRKKFIIFVYVVALIKLMVTAGECFSEKKLLTNHVFKVSFYAMIAVSVFINFSVRNGNSKYLLVVSNYALWSWLPLFIVHVIYTYVLTIDSPEKVFIVMRFSEPAFELLGLFGPIVAIYFLGKLNKQFGICFKSVLKRSEVYDEHDDVDDDSIGNSRPRRSDSVSYDFTSAIS